MPKTYLNKHIGILINLVTLIFLSILLYYLFCLFSEHEEYDKCLVKKEMKFASVISEIVDDTINSKQKLILLNNGKQIETYYTNEIWSNLEIGDSIVKESGTYTFQVYRNLKKFTLDFNVDCE